MPKQRIGFIGLGIMGKPMAMNLIRAGFPLTVYNRTASRMTPLIEAGAQSAESPEEVARNSDVIITIVTDTPDVQDVILGDHGVLHGAARDSVVIDMSTISPHVTREIARKLNKKSIHMLDAPVSGGDTGAHAGTLAIMIGGDQDIVERCRPVFEAMGKTITHVGANGMGQTVKLCNQILVTVTNMAVCEAVRFARQAGVDPHAMIKATEQGAAGSWQLSNLGPKMVERDFEPGFMVDLQQKDLRLALEAAREMTLPLPAVSLVYQMFLSCQSHGENREGTQALIKAFERLSTTLKE